MYRLRGAERSYTWWTPNSLKMYTYIGSTKIQIKGDSSVLQFYLRTYLCMYNYNTQIYWDIFFTRQHYTYYNVYTHGLNSPRKTSNISSVPRYISFEAFF